MNADEILERTQWDFFWVPADVTIVDRPSLLYVHCPRDVSHLNAVTRFRARPEALPAIFSELAEVHRGVESRFMVVPHTRSPGLEDGLLTAGYEIEGEHDAMAIECDSFVPRETPGILTRRVTTLDALDDAIGVTAAAFGRDLAVPTQQRVEALEGCTGKGSRAVRFTAHDASSGEPLCAGGLTVFPELSFGLLWGGGTIPGGRGKGAYSAVVAARVLEARRQGLQRVGLYARLDTSAPIVERQGFGRHGRMIFWSRRNE